MKLSDLIKFLEDDLKPEIFINSIRNEVDNYTDRVRTKPYSVQILLQEDISPTFTKEHFVSLLEKMLQEVITKSEYYYIADALSLSHQVIFIPQNLREIIEQNCDPEVNGEITRSKARSLIDELSDQ